MLEGMYDGPQEQMIGPAMQQAKCADEYRPPTARRQLEQKRTMIQRELQKVDAALAALDAHPDLEEFTETLKAALR